MKATWTKLRSGDWGVRIEGDVDPSTGVWVVTKAGKRSFVDLKKKLWSKAGVSVWSVQKQESPKRSSGDGKDLATEKQMRLVERLVARTLRDDPWDDVALNAQDVMRNRRLTKAEASQIISELS